MSELQRCVFWMQKLAALAVLLQTLELLRIRSSYSESGVWAWSVLRRELLDWPVFFRRFFDLLLNSSGFWMLLWVRLGCAVLALGLDLPLLWLVLWVSTVLIAFRWRGTFNGGSDYMTIIVLGALTVSSFASWGESPRVLAICLGYVGLQVVLSFFVAGIAKLRQAEWRSGEALSGFLNSEYYGVPKAGVALTRSPAILRWLAWGVIGFECLFPIALADGRVCLGMIGIALLFQLANAFIFGLNRFFWAWASAYPALYGCCLILSLHH